MDEQIIVFIDYNLEKISAEFQTKKRKEKRFSYVFELHMFVCSAIYIREITVELDREELGERERNRIKEAQIKVQRK